MRLLPLHECETPHIWSVNIPFQWLFSISSFPKKVELSFLWKYPNMNTAITPTSPISSNMICLISLLNSVTPTGPFKGQPLEDLDFHGDADHPMGAAAGDSMSQVDRVFKSTSGYGSKRGTKNMKGLQNMYGLYHPDNHVCYYCYTNCDKSLTQVAVGPRSFKF